MNNVSTTLHSLRAISCASLATLLIASCGGGGGGSADPAANPGSAAPTIAESASGSSGVDTSSPKADAPAAENNTASPVPFGQNASQYEFTFSDEFENGFNTKVWNDRIWYEAGNATKNYTVEDGSLKIWPQRDANGRFFNRTIDTDGKVYQKYGYFEIEAKLPKGKGTWPAFWLFNHIGDRRPEIDVMEAYAGGEGWGYNDSNGVARPTVYAVTIWEGLSDSNNRQLGFKKIEGNGDLSEKFNKYAVKWEPNKQTYYFNGKEVYSVNISMNDPMYMMLDLWYGSAAGRPDDRTPQGKQNSYEIKYIRAWQFKK